MLTQTANAQDKYDLGKDSGAVSISKDDALYWISKQKGLIVIKTEAPDQKEYVLRLKGVETHMPYAVVKNANGDTSIDYNQVVPILVEAIQELLMKVETLEEANKHIKEEAVNESIRVNNELNALRYDVDILKQQLLDLYPPVTEQNFEEK